MVSPGAVAGVILIVAIHTILAGIVTRFVRLYASTTFGTIAGVVVTVSFVLFASTLVLSGAFKLGFDLQDQWLAALVAIGLPLGLGATIDYLWVASPEEVEAAIED